MALPVSFRDLLDELDDEHLAPAAAHALLEFGRAAPEFLCNHVETIRTLLSSSDESIVACGLAMFSRIAILEPNVIWRYKTPIIKHFEQGTGDVQEAALMTLAVLAASTPTRRNHLSPMLVEALRTCRTNDLPRWTQRVIPALSGRGRAEAAEVLSGRIAELDREARSRIVPVLKKYYWSSSLAIFPGIMIESASAANTRRSDSVA